MKHTIMIFLIFTLLLLPSTVHADMAPPAQPPGANPVPGSEGTQVRMLAETVMIDVQLEAPSSSLGRAHVTADFTMHNTGSEVETMAARFPISASDGYYNYPELTDLNVKVDGKNVQTRRIQGEDPYYGSGQVPWAEFEVTFPPGQDIQVRVSYSVDGSGEYPYIAFTYLLSTGAGWKDTIGSADLIVRFPYEANTQNVILDTHTGWSLTTTGGSFSGKEIRWHFDDLEPTREDNFEISLVMPSAWKKVLNERENVTNNPSDGEAWGRLGKIYKEIFFLRKDYRRDTGGLELYNLSVQAYEKAVSRLPNDALWHAGFADLLAAHACFASYENIDTSPEFIRGLQEIRTALTISPRDPKVLEIADNLYYFFPDGAIKRDGDVFDFIWLTTTPTPQVPTATVEFTPVQTESPPAPVMPSLTPPPVAPTPNEPKPGSALPFCGGALLVPLAAVLVIKRRR